MEAFSSEHMTLLHSVLGSPMTAQSALDRWWRLASDEVKQMVVRSARRRSMMRDLVEELHQEATRRVIERILEGGLDATQDRSAHEIIRRLVDDVARAAARRDKRERERHSALTELPSPQPKWRPPLESPARDEVVRAQEVTALRIRELRLRPMARLLLILITAPGGFIAADLKAALEGGVKLPGTREGATTRLRAWVERAVDWNIRNPGAKQTGTLRAELAWILRGEPDSAPFEQWPEPKRRRGVNWLDQNLRRARQKRDELLEVRARPAATVREAKPACAHPVMAGEPARRYASLEALVRIQRRRSSPRKRSRSHLGRRRPAPETWATQTPCLPPRLVAAVS